MVHFPDPETPIEDTLAVMSDMVDEGKVRQIGCSNFDPAQLNEALAVSAEHGWPPFVCDQVQYSMIHREPETSGLANLCVEIGVALLPYYPLANGLLTGKTRRGGEPQGQAEDGPLSGFPHRRELRPGRRGRGFRLGAAE